MCFIVVITSESLLTLPPSRNLLWKDFPSLLTQLQPTTPPADSPSSFSYPKCWRSNPYAASKDVHTATVQILPHQVLTSSRVPSMRHPFPSVPATHRQRRPPPTTSSQSPFPLPYIKINHGYFQPVTYSID